MKVLANGGPTGIEILAPLKIVLTGDLAALNDYAAVLTASSRF
jgi:hypothetical protein